MEGTLALCPPCTKFRIFLFKQKWRIQFDVVPASPSPRTLAVTPRACGVSSTPRLLDSIISVSGILDRPVKPGDDGWIQFRIPATLSRPGRASAIAPRKQRAQGMPGASRTRSLACEIKKHTSIVTAGPAGFTRHSLRNGFNGLSRALPGDRALFATVACESCLPQT